MWLSHDLAEFCVCTKTDSSSVTHCKIYINSITKAKCPLQSTQKAKMVCFVPIISHGFSFVPWGTTCLQRKKWPFMNQFFESLYKPGLSFWESCCLGALSKCQRHNWCLACSQTAWRALISDWSLSDNVNQGLIPREQMDFIHSINVLCLVSGTAFSSVVMKR